MPPLTQILGQAKVDDLVLIGCLTLAAVCGAALVVLKCFGQIDDATTLPAKKRNAR